MSREPNPSLRLTVLAALIFVSTGTGFGQTEGAADPWAVFKQLEGRWEGAIDGRFGVGSGIREYEFVLDDKFLMSRHSSVRMPQEKSPKGDRHREIGIYSHDRERDKIVFRQFVVEGFVNQYVCDTKGMGFVCTAEKVESGPGMSARLTVTFESPFVFDEVFELGSGDELSVFFTNRWTRIP